MGPPKIFDFWGELKPKSPQLLRSSGSCDLSARMGGIMGPPKIFDFWGELKPKSPQLLQSSSSCDLSAESESALSSRTAHS